MDSHYLKKLSSKENILYPDGVKHSFFIVNLPF